MLLDVGILALVFGVTVLAAAVWITHWDMEKLRRDFRILVNEMHANRVLMRQVISSMENAVNTRHRLPKQSLPSPANNPKGQKARIRQPLEQALTRKHR